MAAVDEMIRGMQHDSKAGNSFGRGIGTLLELCRSSIKFMIHPDKLIEIENQPFRPYPLRSWRNWQQILKKTGRLAHVPSGKRWEVLVLSDATEKGL